MAMLGRVDDLVKLVDPRTRLGCGLALLQQYVTGDFSDAAAGEIARLQSGETRRLNVDGDAVYVLMQCYQSKPRREGRFEAHARHTDLQYLWSGQERIAVFDLGTFQLKPAYDANDNVFFPISDATHSHFVVRAGEVAVLSPQDAHAPCLRIDEHEGELVRKLVIKIQDAHVHASGLISTAATFPAVNLEPARVYLKTKS